MTQHLMIGQYAATIYQVMSEIEQGINKFNETAGAISGTKAHYPQEIQIELFIEGQSFCMTVPFSFKIKT